MMQALVTIYIASALLSLMHGHSQHAADTGWLLLLCGFTTNTLDSYAGSGSGILGSLVNFLASGDAPAGSALDSCIHIQMYQGALCAAGGRSGSSVSSLAQDGHLQQKTALRILKCLARCICRRIVRLGRSTGCRHMCITERQYDCKALGWRERDIDVTHQLSLGLACTAGQPLFRTVLDKVEGEPTAEGKAGLCEAPLIWPSDFLLCVLTDLTYDLQTKNALSASVSCGSFAILARLASSEPHSIPTQR